MTAPDLADLSLENRVALMSEAEQDAILAGLDMEELAYDWYWNGRPSQFLPVQEDDPGSDFSVAMVMAGRGFGKTLTGSQWIRQTDTEWAALGQDSAHLRIALLGRTVADVRDVMLEGPSGLLNIWPPSVRDRVIWTPSRRRVDLPSGGHCICYSAEEPDQLRGPAFHRAWADEVAAYKQIKGADDATAWENLRFAVRLGSRPQVLATTTPRRVPLMKQLLAEATDPAARILIRRGKTTANKYLSEAYLSVLLARFAGTTLGRQELDGEMLDDVRGAMTSEQVIAAYRVDRLPAGVGQWIKLVGVDPSVSERPQDECGIVVVYVTATYPVEKRQAYVVEDLSVRGSPTVWGDVLVEAATRHGATVIAETNQGGALVKQAIRAAATAADVRPPVVREVWATKAKQVRAAPVGVAYDRGRVHHVNVLAELEDQETSWVAGESGYSPDRMDAVVHALAAGLFPEALIQGTPGSAVVSTAAGLQLPQTTVARLPSMRGGGRRR